MRFFNSMRVAQVVCKRQSTGPRKSVQRQTGSAHTTDICQVWADLLLCSEGRASAMYKCGGEGGENASDFFPLIQPGFSLAELVRCAALKD